MLRVKNCIPGKSYLPEEFITKIWCNSEKVFYCTSFFKVIKEKGRRESLEFFFFFSCLPRVLIFPRDARDWLFRQFLLFSSTRKGWRKESVNHSTRDCISHFFVSQFFGLKTWWWQRWSDWRIIPHLLRHRLPSTLYVVLFPAFFYSSSSFFLRSRCWC